jgi:hypothetical protein
MPLTKYVTARVLAFMVSLHASIACLGQAIQPPTTINLSSYGGGKLPKGLFLLDRHLVLLPDHSLWVAFPTNVQQGLLTRGGATPYDLRFLHLSPTGTVLAQCTLNLPDRPSGVDLFVHEAEGFTVHAGNSLLSFANDCKPIATLALPELADVYQSLDRKALVITAVGANIQVLKADTLKEIKRIPLPDGVRFEIDAGAFQSSIWNSLIVVRDHKSPGTSCYANQQDLTNPAIVKEWRSFYCPNEIMRAYGDTNVIAANWYAQEPNIAVSGSGVKRVFFIPEDNQIDTSTFRDLSAFAPDVNRFAVFMYDRKRTWFGQNRIVSEHIAVIDLATQKTLLSVPIEEYSSLSACSITEDGKLFAVMNGFDVSVYHLQ